MLDNSRYPKFNDPAHERPILSFAGQTLAIELAWILIPIALLIIAYFIR